MIKENYFTIIDFGSSKVRLSVFDSNLKEKFSDSINVIYNKENNNHFEIIERLVKIAEKKILFHIKDIILTLDSSSLITIGVSLNKKLDKKTPIDKVYKLLVLELKKIISLYYSDQYLVHILMDRYNFNNQTHNEFPKEKIIIDNIKVDFKVICFPKILIKKIKNDFIKLNLNLVNIFCTSYIKSLSYLKKLKKSKLSFLEIGRERTSFFFYENNKLKLIQTIPLGSFHITKDISNIFKLPLDKSENIKKSFNKSETEFSYRSNSQENSVTIKDIIDKNISVDLLKKVILYRVQEIIDLIFKKSDISNYKNNLTNSELFLIGQGALLFNNNSFYLDDKFDFKSINFYEETDSYICKCALTYHLYNYEMPEIMNKRQGFFEKFFNYFNK